jgi:1,4-dihydroxy-2-naphthoyl-CoA hydrolase
VTEAERPPPRAYDGDAIGDLARSLGIEVLEASPERVAGAMPVQGGVYCVFAETLGSVGASLHAGPGRTAAAIEINATHHGAPGEAHLTGQVTGVATRVHGGRTLAGYEIVISDDQDRRICTARLTCMLRDRS